MITNNGKKILAKYLIGQAPSYASYIAVGCGATPKATGDNIPYGNYLSKTELDFEMFRVPIISRGYVNEDGVSKIVLTGELPTEERYEITEIGIFSAKSNPSALTNDSKMLYTFSQGENWEYHTTNSSIAIPTFYSPLDTATANVIDITSPVFQTNGDNRIFSDSARQARYEQSRYLNNMVMLAGNTSTLSYNGTTHEINENSSSTHIHMSGINLDFNKNTPDDELRLAFSIINKDGRGTVSDPKNVKIVVEFSSTDHVPGTHSTSYAKMQINIDNVDNSQATDSDPNMIQHDFSNRYIVIKKKLKDLIKNGSFTWSAADIVSVYVCVTNQAGSPSDDFYVALDALRLENVSDTNNPIYGLTGYSEIRTDGAKTITKLANTTNFIEFRFAVGVE
jgi:hypothetical protein